MAKRNIVYRVMVYDDSGNAFCEYETSKESKAYDYAHQKVMPRAGVQRFYIDKCSVHDNSHKRFLEDEDY